MKTDKKPDNVVYNPETETYDAALKPYSTSVGAPVITTTDNISWKNRSISKINHKVEAKYLELQAEYQKMMEEFEYKQCNFNALGSFYLNVDQTWQKV